MPALLYFSKSTVVTSTVKAIIGIFVLYGYEYILWLQTHSFGATASLSK